MNTASRCLCCLRRDVTPLINLKNCTHSRFLRDLLANLATEIDDSSLVCCRCHQVLENVEQFRAQVLESQSLMKKPHTYQKRKTKILNDLSCTPVDIMTNEESMFMETVVKSEPDDNYLLNSLHTEEMIEDSIKVEMELEPEPNGDNAIEEGWSDPQGDPIVQGDPSVQDDLDNQDSSPVMVVEQSKRRKLYCAALDCLKTSDDPTLNFHCLPRNAERRRGWLTAIERYDLLKKENLKPTSYVVCSSHFEKSAFKITKKLREDAIPSIFFPRKRRKTCRN